MRKVGYTYIDNEFIDCFSNAKKMLTHYVEAVLFSGSVLRGHVNTQTHNTHPAAPHAFPTQVDSLTTTH